MTVVPADRLCVADVVTGDAEPSLSKKFLIEYVYEKLLAELQVTRIQGKSSLITGVLPFGILYAYGLVITLPFLSQGCTDVIAISYLPL